MSLNDAVKLAAFVFRIHDDLGLILAWRTFIATSEFHAFTQFCRKMLDCYREYVKTAYFHILHSSYYTVTLQFDTK
jgi:hypothetical protein